MALTTRNGDRFGDSSLVISSMDWLNFAGQRVSQVWQQVCVAEFPIKEAPGQ